MKSACIFFQIRASAHQKYDLSSRSNRSESYSEVSNKVLCSMLKSLGCPGSSVTDRYTCILNSEYHKHVPKIIKGIIKSITEQLNAPNMLSVNISSYFLPSNSLFGQTPFMFSLSCVRQCGREYFSPSERPKATDGAISSLPHNTGDFQSEGAKQDKCFYQSLGICCIVC